MGAGADAFRLEKEFIQSSDKRIEFIKKLVEKCKLCLISIKIFKIVILTVAYLDKVFRNNYCSYIIL